MMGWLHSGNTDVLVEIYVLAERGRDKIMQSADGQNGSAMAPGLVEAVQQMDSGGPQVAIHTPSRRVFGVAKG